LGLFSELTSNSLGGRNDAHKFACILDADELPGFGDAVRGGF
jgi:hypothetical protein